MSGDNCLVRYHIEGAPRDVDLLAQRAHRGISARGLCSHHDFHTVASGGHRIRIRIRRLDGPVHAAEKIDLVRHLKEILEQPDRRGTLTFQLQDLVRDGITAVNAARNDAGGRVAIRMHGGESGPCRGEVGIRRRKVEIRLERFLYELIEPWIGIQVPPRIGGCCGRLRCRVH